MTRKQNKKGLYEVQDKKDLKMTTHKQSIYRITTLGCRAGTWLGDKKGLYEEQ